MNTSNPNLARPESLFQKFQHFDVGYGRFVGAAAKEQGGGVPMMYLKDKRRLAVDASDSHSLILGASGSKKTRDVVMPTIKVLAQAGESMIINDPKSEIYQRLASELTALDYKIITLNLRDPEKGYAWNPLAIPYRFYKQGDVDKAAEFANDIANTLILHDISTKDPFFDYSAYDLCLGLILMLFKICKAMNYPDGAADISNLLRLRRKLFENDVMPKSSDLWKWASQDELIAASLTGTVMTASDTRRGILAVWDQRMRALMLRSSLLDMLADSNFEITDIAQQKTAVFLITPDEKTSYAPIVAMFLSQSYQQLIHSATQQGGRLPVRVNYVLDEFSVLPAIGSDFPSMISAARSRNIRYMICIQSRSQLKRRYHEEADTIVANCTNWIVLFTRELDLLREVSALCGEKRDRTPNISVYDLQHLSKEKDEALLLSGKEKPCIVQLLDIDKLATRDHRVVGFDTPVRSRRISLDFSDLPEEAKPKPAAGITQYEPPKESNPFFRSQQMSDELKKRRAALLHTLAEGDAPQQINKEVQNND